MALTRAFKETVHARAQNDVAYRRALLQAGVDCLLEGDLPSAKSILRTYINATLGFEQLATALGRSSKSLMRMLGPKGNPQMANFVEVLNLLQAQEGIKLKVTIDQSERSSCLPKFSPV